MKNPAPYIRQAIFALLDGAITYAGVQVPVYESEYVGEPVPYKIEIAGMDGFNRDDKAQANYDYSQEIEIISEGRSWVRKHVDTIGNEVLQIIKPNHYTTPFFGNGEWQVTKLKIQPPHYIEDIGADGSKIMRAIIRLDFTIHEK